MAGSSDNIQSNYPATYQAVIDLSHVEKRSPKVFKQFLRFSGLKRKQARTALNMTTNPFAWGSIPSVVVAEPNTIPGYARYPGTGSTIKLGSGFVRQFEDLISLHGPDGPGQNLAAARRNARLLMEGILLHELVHWARATISMLTIGPRREKDGEVGWAFTRAAYGRDMTSDGMGVSRYIGNY